ncbi:MAG: hypothetical protein JWO53_1113 [Chlamydiia bacterium]|nr:hypothetical protein [Chlamydiia bacterium]
MTLQRVFFAVTILLFTAIGGLALLKKQNSKNSQSSHNGGSSSQQLQVKAKAFDEQPIEIDLKNLSVVKDTSSNLKVQSSVATKQFVATSQSSDHEEQPVRQTGFISVSPLPAVDRTELLFQKNSPLPIVETLRYKAKVSWKAGKPAWLIDYATHYKTPIDFIARSINERPDYIIKNIADGREFNILHPDKDFSFFLAVDLARCQLWLYYVDPTAQETFLLKNYRIGLGRLDNGSVSGSLTPVGTYKLGTRIAVYRPKMMGFYCQKRIEMMRVFGTRWIPFEREVENCSEPAKGFGIHGTPWAYNEERQALTDTGAGIGGYESDGCIRLKTPDIEELYSIITTRDTLIQIVRDINEVKLPYKEKS